MRKTRRKLLILLFLVQPLSSWAAQLADCASESQFPATAHGEMSHSHHGMSQSGNAVAADIDCCDDCAEACPGSGGGVTVSSTAASPLPDLSTAHSAHLECQLHGSPGPESLYRPPISLV